MDPTRRMIIGAATTVIAFSTAKSVDAQTQPETPEELLDSFPALPSAWSAYKEAPDIALTDLSPVQLGTANPTGAEIAIAQRILSEAPHGTKQPLDVARYFADIGRGREIEGIGSDIRHYVRGWPVRYNPVIVNFFVATNTNPLSISGDYTAWCAAFINWCIARAFANEKAITLNDKGLMTPFANAFIKGTKSASSGSFRCWGDKVNDTPKPGDVIVWATAGSVDGCKSGKGHVGFFIGFAPDGRYITLGGNQRDPSINQSAVVEKRIGKSFTRSDGLVEWHSIRRLKQS